MSAYLPLTRPLPKALRRPRSFEMLERPVAAQVRVRSTDVKGLAGAAVLGPSDDVDMFEAPDVESASRVSTLVRRLPAMP